MRFTASCICGWSDSANGSTAALRVLSASVVKHRKACPLLRTPVRSRGPRISSAWIVVGSVESDSEPGVRHEIKRNVNTGRLGCSCKKYQFAKGDKTCHHVDAFGAAGNVTPATAVSASGETRVGDFTIRRAISFGDVPLGSRRL